MTTDDAEYLLAVAEHRGVGRAAEALGLTQPALTRAVARMEALAGQRLFSRHPRGLEPTAAGEVFLRRALQMRTAYEDALQELHQLKAGQLGILRLGCSPTVDQDMVVAATRRLLQERPAARLQIGQWLGHELLLHLAQGRLDLAVGPLPEPLDPEFAAAPLYLSGLHVVADPAHPLLRLGGLRLIDVVAEPWLLPPPHSVLRRDLARLLSAAGLPELNSRVEMTTLSRDQFQLLLGTRMLGLCSDGWLEHLLGFGLQSVAVQGLKLQREIALMQRRDAWVSPLAERLKQLLLGEVQRRSPGRRPHAAAAPVALP